MVLRSPKGSMQTGHFACSSLSPNGSILIQCCHCRGFVSLMTREAEDSGLGRAPGTPNFGGKRNEMKSSPYRSAVSRSVTKRCVHCKQSLPSNEFEAKQWRSSPGERGCNTCLHSQNGQTCHVADENESDRSLVRLLVDNQARIISDAISRVGLTRHER